MATLSAKHFAERLNKPASLLWVPPRYKTCDGKVLVRYINTRIAEFKFYNILRQIMIRRFVERCPLANSTCSQHAANASPMRHTPGIYTLSALSYQWFTHVKEITRRKLCDGKKNTLTRHRVCFDRPKHWATNFYLMANAQELSCHRQIEAVVNLGQWISKLPKYMPSASQPSRMSDGIEIRLQAGTSPSDLASGAKCSDFWAILLSGYSVYRFVFSLTKMILCQDHRPDLSLQGQPGSCIKFFLSPRALIFNLLSPRLVRAIGAMFKARSSTGGGLWSGLQPRFARWLTPEMILLQDLYSGSTYLPGTVA